MKPRYAASYIDELFADKDTVGLHQVISVLGRRTELPDECWAFCRLLEWSGSRSGIWQYYEGVKPSTYERLKDWLSKTGWQDLHCPYSQGMVDFTSGAECRELGQLLRQKEDEIRSGLVELIRPRIDWIKRNI